MTDPEKKDQFFHKLCQINDSDHSHVKFIKKKIDKLVH